MRGNPLLTPTLSFTPEHEAFREVVRVWIAENDPGVEPINYSDRLRAAMLWQRDLCEAGFIGVSWPTEYGGQGMDLTAEAVVAEELARSSMPQLINRLAVYTWGPTLLDFGTEEQKQRYLPGMLNASEIWCQGFSEPEAGSDLAAIQTKATVDGGELIISGQKVWTSRAEISRYNALLVRTDPKAGPYRGLSLLLLDMESPGVTVRPLPQLLDEPHFSEVFFDDVRVPSSAVLGELHGGWGVSMTAMGYERGLFVLERMIRLKRRLADLVERLRSDGNIEQELSEIGRLYSHLEVLRAQIYRTLAAQGAGDLQPGASSIDKLFMSEIYQDLFTTGFDLLGEGPALEDDGWAHDLLESRSVTIYSGTTEIQRNIIARRLLGLR